jgi:hypothetical protein
VDIDPTEGVEGWFNAAGVLTIGHPLTEGTEREDYRFIEVGHVSNPVESAFLVALKGVKCGVVRGPGHIILAVRYATSGWPASRSFPIFWANVLRYSASGIGEWRAKGLLDEAASRPGMDRKPFDPAALDARPLAPARTDLTPGAVALAAALLALLWRLERRQTF